MESSTSSHAQPAISVFCSSWSPTLQAFWSSIITKFFLLYCYNKTLYKKNPIDQQVETLELNWTQRKLWSMHIICVITSLLNTYVKMTRTVCFQITSQKISRIGFFGKKQFGDFSFFTVVGEEMCVPCLPLALVGCTALEFWYALPAPNTWFMHAWCGFFRWSLRGFPSWIIIHGRRKMWWFEGFRV